jgi:hypothetical protein
MARLSIRCRALSIGITVIMLAGCGGAQSVTSGAVSPPATFAAATVGPPSCNRQHTTKRYASITATLKTKGGLFCVPAFGGFGGSIKYPAVETSVKLTMHTSIKDIYDEPQLGTGTSIVYLNLHFHAGTHFGSSVRNKGGLISATIYPGDAYTAYGIVAVGHLELMFPPCYSIATQGPYGGVIPNLGNLVSNTTITGPGYGVIEIYLGQQVSQEC